MSDNITSTIREAASILQEASDSPHLDCQLIAAYILGRDRAWLIAHGDEAFPAESIDHFHALVERRKKLEPVAYLVGEKEFWGRSYKVTPSTLVPRPETEILVEAILENFDEKPLTVWDLGTGSGIIAISLASERASWQVTGTDISQEALAVALSNATGLTNVKFVQSNWFEKLAQETADVIVSNPPYICESDEHLHRLTHEPLSALAAGPDGLRDIRKLVNTSFERLRPGGCLALEHGYDQQLEVRTLMLARGFANIEELRDNNGQPRVVMARKPAK